MGPGSQTTHGFYCHPNKLWHRPAALLGLNRASWRRKEPAGSSKQGRAAEVKGNMAGGPAHLQSGPEVPGFRVVLLGPVGDSLTVGLARRALGDIS